MSKSDTGQLVTAAQESIAHQLSFAEFMSKLSPKDRANAERRVTALTAESASQQAETWKKLACTLITLAPQPAKFVGKQTVQFYIADGKYRMQVFALEDLQDGNTTVYCPDILEAVLKARLLAPSADAHIYHVKPANEPLYIEALDGNSLNPGAHFKDLVGWNRKAIRITLPPSASPNQINATQLLCAVAAQHFVRAAAPVTPQKPKSH